MLLTIYASAGVAVRAFRRCSDIAAAMTLPGASINRLRRALVTGLAAFPKMGRLLAERLAMAMIGFHTPPPVSSRDTDRLLHAIAVRSCHEGLLEARMSRPYSRHARQADRPRACCYQSPCQLTSIASHSAALFSRALPARAGRHELCASGLSRQPTYPLCRRYRPAPSACFDHRPDDECSAARSWCSVYYQTIFRLSGRRLHVEEDIKARISICPG